jgi:hypothetical protein
MTAAFVALISVFVADDIRHLDTVAQEAFGDYGSAFETISDLPDQTL